MINLLLDCCVFLRVEAGQGNYYQLSGISSRLGNLANTVSKKLFRNSDL